MKNFYSIIYLVANKASNEKVSIGLLAGLEERPVLDFSEKKLNKALKLIEKDVDSNIINLLGNFKKKVENFSIDNSDEFLVESKSNNWPFNFSRANYLSRSADGIIEFSDLKYPSDYLNEKRYVNLFRTLVDNSYKRNKIVKANKTNEFTEKLGRFKNSNVVKERADVDFKVDNELLTTIYDEAKIDLLSANGRILSSNAIDFSMSVKTIEKHLYLYRAISEGIHKFSEEHRESLTGKPRNVLLFSKVKDAKKDKILNSVHNDKDKPFELLELSEIEKIEEELEARNYFKFSEKFL